jgi:Tol biopolymer transport system component
MVYLLFLVALVGCKKDQYNPKFVQKMICLTRGEIGLSRFTCKWMPDSQSIIFLSSKRFEEQRLCYIDIDGKRLTCLTPEDTIAFSFAVSPDGDIVAVGESYYSTSSKKWRDRISLISLITGKKKILIEEDPIEEDPALSELIRSLSVMMEWWSPDGKIIGWEIYYERLKEMGFKKDAEGGVWFYFSPNGKWIVYSIPGRSGFWLESLETPKKRFYFKEGVGDCKWAPDGLKLFFSLYDTEKKRTEHWILTFPTLEKKLLHKGDCWWLGLEPWSLDSKRILYEDRTGINIWDIEANRGRFLAEGRWPIRSLPIWSPDGRLIAYIFDDGINEDLWVMKADGTRKRKLTNFGPKKDVFFAKWSPDGKKILFGTFGESPAIGDLWVIHLTDAINDLKR